ncbi:MAG: hypothetical protein QM493_10060 [Sulfurovum sp.]
MKSLRKFVQTYRKVHQHATIFSAVVVVLLFGFFLQAYMHNFNLVYIMLFFVFALAFSAGPIGIFNIIYLKTKYIHSGRFFAGEENSISIEIENNQNSASWAISLYHDKDFVSIPHLKGDSSIIIQLPFTSTKRGLFEHKGCFLESRYPLSTSRLNFPIEVTYDGITYPHPKGIPLRSFISSEQNIYGEEKEFDGLIEYDGTQKLSHIHWASVAKGDMSVKIFTKESQIPKLIFDFAKAGSDDEAKLSQLTLWVLECEKLNAPFTINMPNKTIKSPQEEIDVILEHLAKY